MVVKHRIKLPREGSLLEQEYINTLGIVMLESLLSLYRGVKPRVFCGKPLRVTFVRVELVMDSGGENALMW